MVAIFSGGGLGLQRGSASVLGATGLLGEASMGRGGDQVFVNAANGNLVVNRRDEFLVGRGPDAFYSQTYNSVSDPAHAWAQGIQRTLSGITGTINTAGSTIVRGDGDGHSSVYTFDVAKGAYLTTEGGGSHDEIRHAGGAWTWTDGSSRISETYTTLSGVPGYYYISSLIDADGNAQAYSWNSNGMIQRITNANGDYSEFTLSAGLPTKITTYAAGGSAILTRVHYAWDSLQRLTSVTVDLSPGDHSTADGKSYSTTYGYDGSSARIAWIVQTDGSRLDIAYTKTGPDYRVTKLTRTVSTGVTRVTGLYYDLANRTTTITDPLGGATTMRYDAAGKLTQIVYPMPQPGGTAPAASFAYNAKGDVVSVTQDGRTIAYDYDAGGNMILSRDSAGNTVTRTYGTQNELLTSTEYLAADPDGAGGAPAGTPLTTRYAYDSENHLRFKVSPEGRVTEYRYDAVGNLAATLHYAANLYNTAGLGAASRVAESALAAWAAAVGDKTTIARTDASYDYRGNVSTVTTYSKTLSDGSGDLGSTYSRVTHVYDPAGNLLSRQTSGVAGSEAFLYDGLNRIVSATDTAGAVTSFSFNDAATTATVTLAGGLTRVSVFNKAGELISLTESGGDIVTGVSTAAYDALGRLRMETDSTGRSTYYLYDGVGRKAAAVTADGAITEYGYDAGNRLVKSVAYINKLTTSQIALLASFGAGGAGGDAAGGVGGTTGSNRVSNGSFDQSGSYTSTTTGRSNTDLPYWTKANAETFEQVSSGQMGVTASDGPFWLDLESVAQTGVITVGSNLLVNPGFEESGSFTETTTGRSNTDLPGWLKTNAETFEQVASGQMGVAASEGSYWLDLESIPTTGPVAVGPNLLFNGGFELSGSFIATSTGRSNSDLPGWTKTNPESFEQIAAESAEVGATEGAFLLDLDSVLAAVGSAPGPNLIVNGSFELSATSYTTTGTGRYNDPALNIPGWVKTNGQGFEQLSSGANGVDASDGDFFLDMEANGDAESRMDISQTIAGLAAGLNLTLKFDYANIAGTVIDHEGSLENSGSLEVYWNDVLIGIVASQDPAMATKGFNVMSLEGDNILRFREIGVADGTGVYLDNVELYTYVPPTNLLVNGSFEQSATSYTATGTGRYNDPALNIPGWVKANGQGFEQVSSGVYGTFASDGSFYLDMEANGDFESKMDIKQTINGIGSGKELTLQFDFANTAGTIIDHEGNPENSGALEVWWNDILIAIVGSHETTMVTKTYMVTSKGGANTLRFREIGITDGRGVSLDNVRLFKTPAATSGGNMDISQTVSNLSAGQLMQLQFDHARLGSPNSSSFEVWWNQTLVATINDHNKELTTKTYFVNAIEGDNTLRFKGTGTVDGEGAALDNVCLFATETPPHGGNMTIYQTVHNLTAGQVLQLQFDHANRTTSASGSFEVWWNDTLVAAVTHTGTTMQTKTYPVTALAGSNTLWFKSLGTVDAAGASIDNVRLLATQPVSPGGNMDISQAIGGLTPGQTFQLQFDHANRTTAASGSFEVWWNGDRIATVGETGTAMQTRTALVTAIAGDNILRFKSLGTVDGAGASIDNVRLFAMQGGGPAATAPTDPLAGLRPTAHALDAWTWHIYDPADRLIETIDGAGRATTFAYDGTSQLVSSTAYADLISASTVAGFKAVTPTAPVLPAGNAVTDRANRSFYDSDGRLVGTLDGAGGLSQIFHDAAGQKIREIAYANPAAANLRATGSFAQLLASAGTSGLDRRVDYVHDQRGLVRFTIDAAGHPTEYVHDSAGRLIRTVDYAGAITTSASYSLAYVQGQLNAGLVADPANRVTRSVYDDAGRLAFSIDAEGGTAAFAYDQAGNLVKQTHYSVALTAAGDQALAGMQAWAASHSNEAGNRVTRQVYDAAGRTAYTVDAVGYVTEQRYDTAGRVTQAIRYPEPYSVGDGVTKTGLAGLIGGMPPAAVVTGYAYDSAGRLTDLTDGAGGLIHYVYDGLGQITDETVAYGTPDAATLHRVYDAAGRIVSETQAYGTADAASTGYGYDALGNLLTITDARGSTTVQEHDALGRVVKATAPIDASTNAITVNVYNRFGDVVKTTDARGHSSYSYYDGLGRMIATRDAEDYVTETAYDAFGDVASLMRRYNRANNAADAALPPTCANHAKDATTSFLYDRLGRLTKTTDAEGHCEQYGYDAFGQRVSVRNKLGGIVNYGFDRRGLLVTETSPKVSYDKSGIVTGWSVTTRLDYDARGNTIRKTEAEGLPGQRITTYVYDKANRLTETHGEAVTVLSQADHSSMSTVTPIEYNKYDQLGRVMEMIDALGARTLFYYDRRNRMVAQVDGLGTLATYAYDANGNVETSRVYGSPIALPATAGGPAPAVPGGEYRQTSHTYDKLDRLKTTTVDNLRTGVWNGSNYATGVAPVTTAFDYDSNGNVVKGTDANGGTLFSFYDRANRKVAQVDQENYLTLFTRDADGNVTREDRLATKVAVGVSAVSDPASLRGSVPGSAADRITQFGYDRNGRRTSEYRLYTNASTVCASGALGVGDTHSGIFYSYNELGQVWEKTFANGDNTSYRYDTMGRLTEEYRASFTDFGDGPARPSVRPTTFYFYDALDNLSVTRNGGASPAAGDRHTRYTYGAGGRLTQMTNAAGASYDYFYDAAGNVVRESYERAKSDGSIVTEGLLYNRDLLGRVTAQGLGSLAGSWTRGDIQNSAYNAYGEVSQRGVNGGWQEQFAYDGAGRMWRTNSGDGVWRYFVHDGNGNQTLTIESEGANLAGLTLDQALGAATAGGAYHVGGAYIDGINATVNVFDKRGQAVETRMPQRQLDDISAATDINASRTYNAFGEVASETDARGHTTDFTYNNMGRLTHRQSPLVNQTGENGLVSSARPVEQYYYDSAGRMIGARDANGNLVTRALLAGTGHDGTEALVAYEFHADGGFIRHDYDVHGDRRISWDEISRRTDMSYDAMGRVTQISRPGGLVEHFGYDQLGQKTSHWNNLLQTPVYGPPEQVWVEDGYWDNYYGWVDTSHWQTHTPIVGHTPDKELTDFDLQGRITRQVAFGGDTTTTSYVWSSTLTTNGMATFGGWTETTTYANSRTSVDSSDIFGRQVSHTDMGGHVFTVSYDLAGRMASRGGGETLAYAWLNTGMVDSMTCTTGDVTSGNWTSRTTTYGYDAAGHVTSEQTVDAGEESYAFYWNPYEPDWYYNSWSNVTQSATAQYDALGRMTSWSETGSAISSAASNSWQYDLNGNIRRSTASYRTLDAQGNASAGATGIDQYYRFDAMNRVVTEKGILSGGQIVRGTSGTDYTYNAAGERMSATRSSVETYTYNDDGTLHQVQIGGLLRSTQIHDALGRLTRQTDWIGNGVNSAYDRQIFYNAKGQVGSETVATKQSNGSGGWDTYTSYITNTFGDGASYALGAVMTVTSSNWKNGYDSGSNGAKDTFTSNSYLWFDGAVASQIVFDSESGSATNPLWTTTYAYNGSGALTSAQINDGRSRTVTYTNDLTGQALRRDERDGITGSGDPHEIWYRFAGKQMGYVGNNGTLDTDYAASIANRQKVQGTGAFRFGTTTASGAADFDLGVESITSYSQGSGGGSYTVNAGDSLAAIAARLWGDAGLWYKLAEANGLSAGSALIDDQSLIIPAGVMRSTHNASTFRPYDPAETLGDTSPTTPQPNKRSNKCGVFGMILLVAIAVAVSVVTAGAALAALAPASAGIGSIGAGITALVTGATAGGVAIGTAVGAGTMIAAGAIGGAVGSIVSQGVGVATGLQDKFNWKSVAMAGIAGGIGAGLGSVIKGASFIAGAARGAIGSAASQGIGVAIGLQKKFDWAGVAAAGLGGGVGSVAGKALGAGSLSNMSARNIGANLGASAASAIANAAARSLINGSDFGDNMMAALPDIIGSTIGNMIAEGVGKIGAPKQLDIQVAAHGPGQATDQASQPGDITVTASPVLSREDKEFWLARDLVNLRLDLTEARADFERDRSRLNPAALARRQARLDAKIAIVRRMEDIHNRAINAAIGRTVYLREDGREPVAYTIRGPLTANRTIEYGSTRDAARDGIALAFEVARITGDSWERGAIIDRLSSGKYTYRELVIGSRAARNYRIAGEQVTKGTPMMSLSPNRNTVGYFHIHPGAPNLGSENNTFSDPDVSGYDDNFLSRNWESFLGGNDGSFRLMRPNVNSRGRVSGHDIVTLQGRGYFSVPVTVRLPTDMRGEHR